MTLTVENGVTSLPADGNSTAKIIVDAHDLYGFPLVSVNVNTTDGNIVNGAYETQDENIGVSDDGTISFDLKAGIQATEVVTVTVTTIPSGLQKTIQFKFTTP